MSTKKEKLLSGEIPITREELLVLVNSWGRLESFNIFYQNATSNLLLLKKEWLNDNRDRMNDLDIKDKYGNQIDVFFTNITNLTKEIKR